MKNKEGGLLRVNGCLFLIGDLENYLNEILININTCRGDDVRHIKKRKI